MPFEDKTIICSDCGQPFTHSADDQQRYAERGFTNEPKRCRPCREKHRAQAPQGGPRTRGPRPGGPSSGGGRPPRESFEVVCAACGATTTVPFKPEEGRPVYCRDCYQAKRPKGKRPSSY